MNQISMIKCSYNFASDDDQLVLWVNSTAHVLHAFVNDEFVGECATVKKIAKIMKGSKLI